MERIIDDTLVTYSWKNGYLFFESWGDFIKMANRVDSDNLKGLEIDFDKLRFTKAYPMEIDIFVKQTFENENMHIAICLEEDTTKIIRGNKVAYVHNLDGVLEYC